jgi:two-component sensor histidine kinase
MHSDAKVNILLVDDHSENLIALEAVLEGLGQNLVRAHSGMEALKWVLNQEFAVILLDVQMPDMDGFETATLMRAREKSRHIPIIFLTAINKNDTHVFKGYSVGAVDYVFKPFDPDVLRAKVAAFVEMSRNVTRLREEITQRRQTEARLDASHSLLETISRALMLYIADGHPANAFEHLLQNLLTLTQSEYGFIGEILTSPKANPSLKYHALSESGQKSNTQNGAKPLNFPLLDAASIKALCSRIESSGHPFIAASSAELPTLHGVPEGSSPLQNLLAMPIYTGKDLVGIVGIANGLGGYSEDLATSLEPFCSICAGILDGYRNALRRQQAEEEVRKLNEDLECRVVERTADLEAANSDLQTEITHHQRAKEILARHQEHIEALNERLRRSMTETHHRVKNNLQIVAAMLDMRLMEGLPTIPAKDIHQLGVHVRALAAVHDLLTQESKEGDGQAHYISAHSLLNDLIPMLQSTSAERPIEFEIADARLTARQGTSLALVVNELVSNALKYGVGLIRIRFTVKDGNAYLEVCDDGPGFPEGFDPIASANTGLELVQHLSRWDLEGTVLYRTRAEGGACVLVTMPLDEAAAPVIVPIIPVYSASPDAKRGTS